jgi:SAM-dependent methyltransferase
MAEADIKSAYSARYTKQDTRHRYPVEFVVRAFLGTYPSLKLDASRYVGTHVLDLGCGDGRNMPLLHNLGFEIHGVEIHQDIIRATDSAMKALGIDADLKVGTNARIPFDADFFSALLACHACYYVEEGTTFKDNLREMHRVMKKDALFVASLPMRDTYVLKDAEVLGQGHFRIKNDPYGLRAGTIFRAFENESEIESELAPYFSGFKSGFCDDFYWGIRQKVWIVVSNRK